MTTKKSTSKVHRGRGKLGLKALTISLTPGEWEALKDLADQELRSASGQAVWIIRQYFTKKKKTTKEST